MINATTTIGVTFLCLSLMSIAPLHVCVNCITRYSTPNTLNTSSFFVNHFFQKNEPFQKGFIFHTISAESYCFEGFAAEAFCGEFPPFVAHWQTAKACLIH